MLFTFLQGLYVSAVQKRLDLNALSKGRTKCSIVSYLLSHKELHLGTSFQQPKQRHFVFWVPHLYLWNLGYLVWSFFVIFKRRSWITVVIFKSQSWPNIRSRVHRRADFPLAVESRAYCVNGLENKKRRSRPAWEQTSFDQLLPASTHLDGTSRQRLCSSELINYQTHFSNTLSFDLQE